MIQSNATQFKVILCCAWCIHTHSNLQFKWKRYELFCRMSIITRTHNRHAHAQWHIRMFTHKHKTSSGEAFSWRRLIHVYVYVYTVLCCAMYTFRVLICAPIKVCEHAHDWTHVYGKMRWTNAARQSECEVVRKRKGRKWHWKITLQKE